MGCVPRGFTVSENTLRLEVRAAAASGTGPAPLRPPAPTGGGSRGADPSPPAVPAAPASRFCPAPSQRTQVGGSRAQLKNILETTAPQGRAQFISRNK